jgi:hypothetical protein
VAIYWTTRVIHTTSPPIQRARTTSTHASLVGTARARGVRTYHHTAGACMDARAGHALSGARLLSAADSAPPPRHDHEAQQERRRHRRSHGLFVRACIIGGSMHAPPSSVRRCVRPRTPQPDPWTDLPCRPLPLCCPV